MEWIYLADDNERMWIGFIRLTIKEGCVLDFLNDDYSRMWIRFIWMTIIVEFGLDISG